MTISTISTYPKIKLLGKQNINYNYFKFLTSIPFGGPIVWESSSLKFQVLPTAATLASTSHQGIIWTWQAPWTATHRKKCSVRVISPFNVIKRPPSQRGLKWGNSFVSRCFKIFNFGFTEIVDMVIWTCCAFDKRMNCQKFPDKLIF